MCLATGRTPLPVYAELAARPRSWRRAAVLLLDEFGGLAPGDPGGCDTTLRRTLVDRVDLAPAIVEAAAGHLGDRARPRWGVTVGLADLVAAERVWVLVTGAHKAEVVRACLEGPPGPVLPATALSDHPDCTWWLDEPAAARLARPGPDPLRAQTT